MENKLLIRGAYYYSEADDAVYVPHFTGEYWLCDCDRYYNAKDFIDQYGKDKFVELNESGDMVIVHVDDEPYYSAESGPIETGDFELLSDLSELEYIEQGDRFER